MTSAPVSRRSWVRFPFKPEFFQVSSSQLLKLKHLHCDDLHIILDFLFSCGLVSYSYLLQHSKHYKKEELLNSCYMNDHTLPTYSIITTTSKA